MDLTYIFVLFFLIGHQGLLPPLFYIHSLLHYFLLLILIQTTDQITEPYEILLVLYYCFVLTSVLPRLSKDAGSSDARLYETFLCVRSLY